jgi:hypothetical protein
MSCVPNVRMPARATRWRRVLVRGAQDRLPFCSQNRTPVAAEARFPPGAGPLTCYFSGVSEGIRTPDIQDHNLAL